MTDHRTNMGFSFRVGEGLVARSRLNLARHQARERGRSLSDREIAGTKIGDIIQGTDVRLDDEMARVLVADSLADGISLTDEIPSVHTSSEDAGTCWFCGAECTSFVTIRFTYASMIPKTSYARITWCPPCHRQIRPRQLLWLSVGFLAFLASSAMGFVFLRTNAVAGPATVVVGVIACLAIALPPALRRNPRAPWNCSPLNHPAVAKLMADGLTPVDPVYGISTTMPWAGSKLEYPSPDPATPSALPESAFRATEVETKSARLEASSMRSEPHRIALLFDIDRLGSGAYGARAYSAILGAVDKRHLRGSTLWDGDMLATLEGRGRDYCVVIEQPDANRMRAVRSALTKAANASLLPAGARIVDEFLIESEPLVKAASVSETLALVGCDTGWLNAVWRDTGELPDATRDASPSDAELLRWRFHLRRGEQSFVSDGCIVLEERFADRGARKLEDAHPSAVEQLLARLNHSSPRLSFPQDGRRECSYYRYGDAALSEKYVKYLSEALAGSDVVMRTTGRHGPALLFLADEFVGAVMPLAVKDSDTGSNSSVP